MPRLSRAESKLTHERLLEVLTYDPETGEFRWRIDRRTGRHGQFLLVRAGDIAGGPNHGAGYWQFYIDGENYLAHRVAWFYVTGIWPNGQVDHRNGIRPDNRWDNLRPATQSQQNANSRMRKTNKSGFKGVSWYRGKWRATIVADGKQWTLGYYTVAEEAHDAYVKAAMELFGEFARMS
jgi:hypothetical protein